MSFIEELKRRNVVRVGIAYLVTAWLLMQFTDVLIQLLELSPGIGKVVILFLIIGFPIALIIAWAFELTPEGIKREKDVDRESSITPKTGKSLDRMIIGALGLVVLWFLFDEFYLEPREAQSQRQASGQGESDEQQVLKSIAVLPFADMSQAGDQEWFADGLAEEILNALARAPDILVSSRTSSFAYKGTSTPVSQIAEELGVEHVLEGSVRRAQDRIRVTAQLIRASDGFHVWSENYDRDTSDVIAIQEELAISIARALKTTMDPETLERMLQAGTRSVEAYERYLAGLNFTRQAVLDGKVEYWELGYQEFEKARQLDPQFAAAHANAAEYWRNDIMISRRNLPNESLTTEEKMRLYKQRADAAIATAGNAVDRQRYEAAMAFMEMRLRDAIRLGRSVLEQRPYDAGAVFELGVYASTASDRDTVREMTVYSLSLADRGAEWANVYATLVWRVAGKVDDPAAFNDNIMRLVERYRNPGLLYQAHRALLWAGLTESARSLVPLLAGDENGSLMVNARQACAEGRRADTEALLAGIRDSAGTQAYAGSAWHLLQLLGRPDEAAELLRPFASAEAPIAVGTYLVYPQFNPSSFPTVMADIAREGIIRPAPVPMPFACPPADAVDQRSVAVLPFRSMSSGADDEYFSDGLTEEILNSLTALPELLVTARTSSFHFKDQDLPIPEIAATLGVDHVVEGSVRRSGEKVRITAQLIRADDGFHLWSQTYDRTLEDVFSVQEDIAAKIASTLEVVLDDRKRQKMRDAGIGDVDAFIAYQKAMDAFARAHSTSSPIDGLYEANRYFDEALAIVPDIANAHFLKTDLYGHIIYNNAANYSSYSPAELETAHQEIVSSLQRAIESSDSPVARAIYEVERTIFSDNWFGLSTNIKRGFSPGDCSDYNWFPTMAAPYGLSAEVVQHSRDMVRCDPINGFRFAMLGLWEIWDGNPEETYLIANRLEQRGQNHPWMSDMKFLGLLASANLDDEAFLLGPAQQGSYFTIPRRIIALTKMGKIEQARTELDAFTAVNDVDDLAMLVTSAALGDRATANEYAALMDARFGGAFIIAEAVKACLCGAPFDLEFTPNFKARIEEAGFAWPPPTQIDYPAKDW